jgi:tetratricopeptide (TPR) repeat protein
MRIQPPRRTEAIVWNQQFTQHLQAWLQSRRQDPDRFGAALDALRNLLEREPDAAGYVANLLSTLMRHHLEILAPGELARAATRGLEALRLVTEGSELRTLTRCSLLNHLARAHVELGHYDEALRSAEAAIELLIDEAPFDGAVAELLEVQALVLAGRAREALLDYERALDQYTDAGEAAAGIAGDTQRMSAVLASVVHLEFPTAKDVPQELIKAQIQMLWQKLSRLRVAADVGAGRCAAIASPDQADERLQSFLETAGAHGIGGTTALEMVPMIRAASPDLAIEAVDSLLETVAKLDLDMAEYSGVLHAALSTCDLPPEQRTESVDIAGARIGEIDDALGVAAIYGLLLIGAEDAESRAGYADGFVETLADISRRQDDRLASPANRLMFDEPVLIALQDLCACGDGRIPWDPTLRTVIAQLVDYDFSGHTPLDEWLGLDATEPMLDEIISHARDRLARANSALSRWDATAALVIRSVGDRTLFLALDGDQPPLAVFSDTDYANGALALADHLQGEIDRVSRRKKPGPVAQLEKLGAAAYQAMPAEIRAAIESCDRLLLCPDHRARGGTVPFELFHDGTEWLGIGKEIARFPTLRTLVVCLEGTGRRDPNRRVLSLAVPDVPGWPELTLARDEAESVRSRLEARGWDAPEIDPDRVSANYVLERLPYVSHLHIAAHGEARGVEEFLVLHDGDELSASDLLRRFIPRMPSAYVNACELGVSRWAGSGQVQSIPYAFIATGSRAVVANLLQVEDTLSSELAGAFYAHAADADFGESLMASRAALAGDGVHPVFWGSTVLIGDPTTTLFGDEAEEIVSEAYLNAITLDRDKEAREAAIVAVRERLLTDPDDARLRAAIGLANAMQDEALLDREYGPQVIASACRAAYEVNHLPLLALMVYTAGRAIDRLGSHEQKIRFYDNAIKLVEPLEQEGATWKRMLDELLVKWLQLVRGERMAEPRYHGPDTDDKDEFMAAVQAMTDIQHAMEARAIRAGFGAVARPDESSADDVLWNAVVASRDLQLEGMPERYDFARKIVDKLIGLNALTEAVADDATTAFAGLLNWLWRSQNQVSLAEEMIEGQRGVLGELLASLQQPWTDEPWFKRLQKFETGMTEELASLEGLPYDDKLYPRIDEVIADILTNAEQVLEKAAEDQEVLCRSTAWVLGSLIHHNTYSYLDGSVPESICDRLTRIQEELDSETEGKIYPWLERGFRSVREQVPDELIRWRYGFAQPDVTTEEEA